MAYFFYRSRTVAVTVLGKSQFFMKLEELADIHEQASGAHLLLDLFAYKCELFCVKIAIPNFENPDHIKSF